MITTILACAVTAAVPAGTPTLVLKGLDPIELAKGREVIGKSELKATYLRHEYHFANETNRKRFVISPSKHAVQTGGACGKMGALSGKGSPERWAVVDRKLYLFASDGCRTTFLANQDAYTGPLPRVPAASRAEREEAQTLADQMVNAHGGSAAIASMKRFELIKETPYQDAGAAKIWVERWGYYGGEKFLSTSEWDKGQVWFAVDGRSSSDGGASGQFMMHPAEVRALRAELLRTPAVILMRAKEMAIKKLDSNTGLTLASGNVWFSVLLDPATKRITAVRFRDHYSGPICDVEIEFSDYREVSGVLLPHAQRVRKNGADWSAVKPWAHVKVNEPMASAWAMAFGK